MQEDAMKSTAEALARTFEQSWNNRDGHSYGSAYWPDAELVDPMGVIWDGREAIVQMHVDLWAGPFSETEVRAHVRRVREVSPTTAVVDLEISGNGFPVPPGRKGDGSIATRLKHVIERRGAEWKIAASQNTFVMAMS